jgi:hypothetical protein
MEKLRTSAQERIAAFTDKRVQDWLASADRAEARGESVTALLFRNYAWEIQTGTSWAVSILADATVATSDKSIPPASL